MHNFSWSSFQNLFHELFCGPIFPWTSLTYWYFPGHSPFLSVDTSEQFDSCLHSLTTYMLMILRSLCSTQTRSEIRTRKFSPVPTGPFPLVGCDISISNLTHPRLNSLSFQNTHGLQEGLFWESHCFMCWNLEAIFPSCCALALHIQPISRFCWFWFLHPSLKHPFLLLLPWPGPCFTLLSFIPLMMTTVSQPPSFPKPLFSSSSFSINLWDYTIEIQNSDSLLLFCSVVIHDPRIRSRHIRITRGFHFISCHLFPNHHFSTLSNLLHIPILLYCLIFGVSVHSALHACNILLSFMAT